MTKLVAALALALLLGGCAGASATAVPEIELGRDICMECGMAIDEMRFAAVYRLGDGTERLFDDLGDLILHGRAAGELDDARIWVADFETEAWVAASEAFYVPTTGVTSPMGHGLLAFGDEGRAVATADLLGGAVVTWDVVRDLPVVDGRVGHHHADHAMEDDVDE